MPPRPQICFTFVGTVTRDSRLRRFVRTASAIADVTAVVLTGDDAASLSEATVLSVPHSGSLRRALPRFWRTGTERLPAGGAALYVAADLYSLPLAARLAERHGRPLVYDARELYRAIAALRGRGLMQLFWTRLEQRYARRATTILTVNDSIADILRADYDDVRVVRNYPDGMADAGTGDGGRLRSALGIPAAQRILLSQGGLQRGRGALLCVDALAQLDDAALVFLGDGPLRDDILLHAQVQGVRERVHVHAAVPSAELLTWTASADVGLCMIENLGRSYFLSLPNKLFEYIAAGLPVVGSDLPEIARVLRESGSGVTVPPGDAGALADALRALLAEPAQMATLRERSRAARAHYQWTGEEQKFRAMLEELLDADRD